MSYQRTATFQSRRGANWNRNQNTVAFVPAIKLGPVAHTVLIALMITILGLIYLTQAIKSTGYDYQAQNIDSQIDELAIKKSDLEVENARLSSLEATKNSAVAQTMTAPASTEYVR